VFKRIWPSRSDCQDMINNNKALQAINCSISICSIDTPCAYCPNTLMMHLFQDAGKCSVRHLTHPLSNDQTKDHYCK